MAQMFSLALLFLAVYPSASVSVACDAGNCPEQSSALLQHVQS
eukprot:CAMPEP_0178419492 /NCGR_PEP_ID=MMETSP0689_2-20121128/25638_1 /TAXON_ID=160604 /ORGANISM="Amphidinium massartii, Strain CS-259" /LENGTH=42 /DNA_ID= /DNA_START= /DNA_END= /DNA_ORIENTATION=